MNSIVLWLCLAGLLSIVGYLLRWAGDRFVYWDHSKEWYAITYEIIRVLNRQIVLDKEFMGLADGMLDLLDYCDVEPPYALLKLYEIAKTNLLLRLAMLDDDLRVYEERRDALGEDDNEQ